MPFITKLGSVAARAYGWLATTVSAVTSDAYFYLVSMLLSTTSTNGAQNNTFLDSSANNFTITRNGNATQGTFTPFSNTGWSNYFDGSGDYLTAPSNAAFGFGTGDLTIEGWFWFSGTISTYQRLWYFSDDNDNAEISSSTLRFGGGTQGVLITGATLATNRWYHIAVTRASGSYRLFIDGTQSGSTASNSYNSAARSIALMATTAGANPATGYVSNFRVVRGTALYTGTFTPSIAPLTPVNNTSLLTCQSNRLADASPNNFTITRNGDVRATANGPFAPSSTTPTSYSGSFDGSGDSLTIAGNAALAFGTGDFTVEFWVYITSGTAAGFWDTRNTVTQVTPLIYYDSSTLRYYVNGAVVISGGSLTALTWTHVALARSSGTTRLFVNGSQVGSSYSDTNNYAATNTNYIGNTFNSGQQLAGAISNFRVVKGTAVYTSNFTPPTAPLTAITNTSLLTCQNTTFIDNSTNAFTITANGNAQPIAANPFGATTTQPVSYSTTSDGGAGYFDGTGDFLTAPSNSAYNITSGSTDSFSAECWVYWNTVAVNTSLLDNGGVSGTSFPNWSIYLNASSQITFGWGDSGAPGSTIGTLTSSIVPTAGQWYHIVGCKASSDWAIYVNGIRRNQFTGSNTAAKTSTSVLRIADGINSQNAGNRINGYIAGVRVYKGATASAPYKPSSFPFVMPESPLTAITNTQLLLDFTNAGIYDSAQQSALETVGTVAVSTAQAKFGSVSMGFPGGSGNYITITRPSLIMPSGAGSPFTLETWVYLNSLTASTITRTDPGLALYANSSGAMLLDNTNVVNILTTANSLITTGAWYHIAITRTTGNVYTLYINGTSRATATYTSSISANSSIGLNSFNQATYNLNGYLQDFRVTNFVRYTTNFTPPTAAFPTK